MKTLKTAFLLTALTLFLILIGAWVGGRDGMILAFFIAAGMNFFSYFYSDKLALSMYRAQPVTREQLPRVYQIVERILPRMGIPMPRIYVIPTESPNAFATGRNPSHAAVAVTQGILNLLNDEELDAVLAHELAHVRNYDVAINYAGHAQAWDELTIDGDIASRDCAVRYRSKGRLLAIATINRDVENLMAELAMESEAA